MKANELRIGNLIMDRGDKILRIDSINKIGNEYYRIEMEQYIGNIQVHPLTEYNDYLKPIPLTEEWLLKFGFEKDRYNFIIESGFKFCVEYYNADSIYSFHIYTDGEWHCIVNEIKHVHTLQNLYLALTGEELTIKE